MSQKLDKKPEILVDTLKQRILVSTNEFIDKVNFTTEEIHKPHPEFDQKIEELRIIMSELGDKLLSLCNGDDEDFSEKWYEIVDCYTGVHQSMVNIKSQKTLLQVVALQNLRTHYKSQTGELCTFAHIDKIDSETNKLFIKELKIDSNEAIKIEFWLETLIDMVNENVRKFSY